MSAQKLKDTYDRTDECLSDSQAVTLHGVFARFKKSFFQSGKARAYLKQRGLEASRIDVGFNSGRFHDNQSKITNEAWVKAGLLTRHNGGYRVFARTCLIFALKDKDGAITSLYGRSIRQQKTARHFSSSSARGFIPATPRPRPGA